LISSRRSSVPAGSGWRRLDPAALHDIEAHLAGGTDHQLTAHGHGDRRRRLRGFAWAQAQEHHRGPAGIDRGRNPGIDAEICRRDNAAPIESRGNPVCSLAAGGKEARGQKNNHESTERHRIAQRQTWGRPAGPKLARRQKSAFDVRLPERLRHWIIAVGGNAIRHGCRRTMRFTCAAIETTQTVMDAGQSQDQQWQRRCHDRDCEYEEANGAGKRRQYQPQAGPGKGKK
jgi:hypothetical protein